MSTYPNALAKETIVKRADDIDAGASVRAERSDRQLVDLVLSGEGYAFEELFERHKRLVAIVASRYFRRREEIEEIVQIVFAKAFTELASFQGNHERSMSSWLSRITMNASFDQLRSQKRKPERLECDLSEAEADALLHLTADTSMTPEKQLLERDLTEKILALVPPDDRMLLQMLYSEDMSTADIAEVLGWSRSNVKVRAWRARSSVKRLLKGLL